MEKKELISVIIPIYKVEKYLNRCIQSVVEQTYRNLEIILVDDGSPDNCPAICDDWAKRDSRIKVLHKTNGGLSDARNAGMAVAKGAYIGFVDSDDYIDAEMYEKLYKAIKLENADLAICSYEKVTEDGTKISEHSPIKNETFSQLTGLKKLTEAYSWYYVTVWNKLYKKSVLENIKFPIGKLNEDQFIIHQLFFRCNRITSIDDALYKYVHRAGSIMTSTKGAKCLDEVEALCQRVQFYKEHGLTEYYNQLLAHLKEIYVARRYSLDESYDQNEKQRIREIDKMFKETYCACAEDVSLKEKIEYTFPTAWFAYYRFRNNLSYNLSQNKRILAYAVRCRKAKSLLVDTPIHGNLGDHAICIAENQVLNERCQDKTIYEITGQQINGLEHQFARVTPKNKCIMVNGGGFLGTLWPEEEERFRRIVQAFRKQKIIVFPQTVTFDLTTEKGLEDLEQSQKIYSAHSDLTIFIREKKSLEFMKEYFPKVNTILVPDIVTIMKHEINEQYRAGIIFCMRKDIEKNISDAHIQNMLNTVQEFYPSEKVEFTDTVEAYEIYPDKREQEVAKKLTQFAKAKLVVTDRLHGMIFAAITNTPCIALGNSNGKVKAVYEWIKDNDFIIYLDNPLEFADKLKKIDLEESYDYNNALVENAFEPLYKVLERI